MPLFYILPRYKINYLCPMWQLRQLLGTSYLASYGNIIYTLAFWPLFRYNRENVLH